MTAKDCEKFVIPATASAIDGVCDLVKSRLHEKGYDKEWFATAMLLREGLNNAMIHGYNNDSQGQIRCKVVIGDEWLRIRIEDDGAGFNWLGSREEVVDEMDTSGRGIIIYKIYADKLVFNRRGNHVLLCRRIRKEKAMPTIQIERNGKSARIAPLQHLAVSLANELRPQIQKLIGDGVTDVIYDLSQVEVVDSSGIGLLIATHNTLKKNGGSLRIVGVSAEIQQLFKAMRLDKHFTVEGR